MMKKALQISIAQTLFTIEDDAYAALEAYLASVKEHFKNTEGHEEILKDIESRIAEQLLESKESVITHKTLEKVLTRMGKVEDFDDTENTENEGAASAENSPGAKKLYRNPDDVMIAGVCSGIAAYFGWDTIWVRLAFAVLTLINGIGILIYIVLWIIMPEAKTVSQKLEMRGAPVTLETLSEKVNERVEELKQKNGSNVGRIVAGPFRMLGLFIAALFTTLGYVARYVIGSILVIAAALALVGTMTLAGFMISGETLISNDVPLQMLVPGALHWMMVLGVAAVAIVPLTFILITGISILTKRTYLTAPIGFGLLGVWLVSLAITSFGAASIANNYQEIVRTSPAHREIISDIPVSAAFSSISVLDGIDITIVNGTSTRLTAEGREKDIASVRTRIDGTVLVIERDRLIRDQMCLFCFSKSPHLTLAVPNPIDNVTSKHGSSVSSEDFPAAPSLTLLAEHGSVIDLKFDTLVLKAELSHGSHMQLEGTTSEAEITLRHGSRFGSENFSAKNAVLNAAHGSSAEIKVSETLNATASHGSSIIYAGNPEVAESAKSGSEIEAAQ